MVELRLREILKERQITVAQFAEMAGISQSNISNYMGGKISPTVETLNKIATTLGIEITELFKKKEDVVLVAKYEGLEVEINSDELVSFIKQKMSNGKVCDN